MPRKHDRSHFFKYTSFETAMRIVQSHSFLWSSPTKFNDPFDSQVGFVLDSNSDQLAKLLTASIERIVFSDVIPPITPHSKLAALILLLRSIRHKLPRETILSMLHEGSIKSAARCIGLMEPMNTAIREQLNLSRVLSLSELHDNVVMWSHYADQHRGVVFKLRCVEELDNVALGAIKMTYTNDFPNFPSHDEYAKHLTGEKRFDFPALCMKLAFMKHTDWAYEKEWRVVSFMSKEEHQGDGYSTYTEHPQVFEAVYLGCRMEDKEVKKIVERIREHLPVTKILRGKKSSTAFALAFHEI